MRSCIAAVAVLLGLCKRASETDLGRLFAVDWTQDTGKLVALLITCESATSTSLKDGETCGRQAQHHRRSVVGWLLLRTRSVSFLFPQPNSKLLGFVH